MRTFPEWKPEGLRTAMDLGKELWARVCSWIAGAGTACLGRDRWSIPEEAQATIDGILTIGILWLEHCRATGDGRRVWQGLKVVDAARNGNTDRLAHGMSEPACRTVGAVGAGWRHRGARAARGIRYRKRDDSPDSCSQPGAVRERFSEATARVMSLVPETDATEGRGMVSSGAEMVFPDARP